MDWTYYVALGIIVFGVIAGIILAILEFREESRRYNEVLTLRREKEELREKCRKLKKENLRLQTEARYAYWHEWLKRIG